jgi:ubiquinone/menaquinone biosynthesis C-methylase UbiE
MTAVAPGVPAGNTFDKYGSANPVVKRLVSGFRRSVDQLLDVAAPDSVLDVGCGEGVLTESWAIRLDPARVVGIDLADPKLQAEWSARARENLEFVRAPAEQLPFADDEFELVAAVELLEHVRDPRLTLSEMVRVSSGQLLVSVPREPLWRALNVARLAYLRELGNTPGHVNHWSRSAFVRLLEDYGEVVQMRTPFPWTMLLVRSR